MLGVGLKEHRSRPSFHSPSISLCDAEDRTTHMMNMEGRTDFPLPNSQRNLPRAAIQCQMAEDGKAGATW